MNNNIFSKEEQGAIKKQYNYVKYIMNEDPDNHAYYEGYLHALEFVFGEDFFNKKDFMCSICTNGQIFLTQALLEYLKDIGYDVSEIEQSVDTNCSLYCHNGKIQHKSLNHVQYHIIDNLDIFKAMAARRYDSDYMQWFTREGSKIMELSPSVISPTYASPFVWRKSTYGELCDKFENK